VNFLDKEKDYEPMVNI